MMININNLDKRSLRVNSVTLRKLLNKHERSQRWLARQLDVSYQAMYKWANDLMPISKERQSQIREILK